MKSIIRRIDRLGRIVLPIDYRKALGLCKEAEVVITVENNTIAIRGTTGFCKLCGTSIKCESAVPVCMECVKKIISAENYNLG